MKINKNSNLLFSGMESIIEMIIDKYSDGGNEEGKAHAKYLNHHKGRIFYFTKSSMEIVNKIKVDQGDDFSKLHKTRYTHATMFHNEDSYISYISDTTTKTIWYLCIEKVRNPQEMIFAHFGRLVRGIFGVAGIKNQLYKDMNYYARMELAKKMIFMDFTDPELLELEPGKSNNKSKKEGKVVNETFENITTVSSSWNKIYLVQGGTVSGHFRLQAHGPRWKDRKLIFINPYQKNSYIKKNKI